MKPEEIRQAKEAIKGLQKISQYYPNIPKPLLKQEFLKQRYDNALSLALTALSIVENLPEVADIYGWLFDIVNIAEHLRGEERIEYLRKEATGLSTRRISKGSARMRMEK